MVTRHGARSVAIGNEIIKTVGKSGSCMVSILPIIFKRTRSYSYSCCGAILSRARLFGGLGAWAADQGLGR